MTKQQVTCIYPNLPGTKQRMNMTEQHKNVTKQQATATKRNVTIIKQGKNMTKQVKKFGVLRVPRMPKVVSYE